MQKYQTWLTIGLLAATSGAISAEASPPCADRNPERNAYWGELHIHTTLSSDAWRSRVATSPDAAYGFARGETISIPPLDEAGNPTQTIQIDRWSLFYPVLFEDRERFLNFVWARRRTTITVF